MSHPKWSIDLSVGLSDIDAQHKELFAISEDLYRAIQEKHGDEELEHTFRRLETYVGNHFAAEEAYMRGIKYPDLKAHMAEHAQLLLRFRMLWNLKKNRQPITAEGVAYFLGEWITEHITSSDKAIGEYARSIG